MRAVVRAFLEQDLTRQLGDVNRTMLEQIDLVERAFEQLGHAVSYSMGTVAVELREEEKILARSWALRSGDCVRRKRTLPMKWNTPKVPMPPSIKLR